ncbi:MAG: DUF2330 domain-containing protein [Parvularcula sp.]|jgi:hypothetical protein|nr:DUF2330 domain-containing protein [Parvularcula sp.]
MRYQRMKFDRTRVCLLMAGTLAVFFAAAPPNLARACGGFFCSQAAPVFQAAEQIMFALDQEKVTAHIQITYEGTAEEFSWVVPVMSMPTIKVGTQSLFTQLQQRTQPVFQATLEGQGCDDRGGVLGGTASSDRSSADAGAGGGVEVLASRQVGPYETEVFSAPSTPILLQWLAANGYDQPPEAESLFDHYVKAGMLFVGLKLRQEATVGDIQPLVLEMEHSEACVPLILTRVAAVPDMPVLVYVAAASQAVPRNWFRVEVNEARIDWRTFGANYVDVVTEAINDAAGHGFVTEYAGSASVMDGALLLNDTDFRSLVEEQSEIESWRFALQRMGIFSDPVAEAILDRFGDATGAVADPDALEAELASRVIEPRRSAQAIFNDWPYLTRMLTTVSPDEMTRDPLFHLNASLPEVSNIHTATIRRGCNLSGETTTTLVLPNGKTYDISDGPVTRNLERASQSLSLVGAQGEPVFYGRSQATMLDELLDVQSPESVRAMVRPRPDNPQGENPLFGCSMGKRSVPVAWPLGLLLALLWFGRARYRA